jgi:iron complex outermembrane receptor protein
MYIIRRDFIVKSGARTLLDILQYIPGVEIAMSSSGKKEIILRGSKSVYRDKIKFLINGVEITNNLYDNQFYYYNFPASLIKRVEFKETPDSVTYGKNAFLGVINIVTLDSQNPNQFYFYANDKNGYTGSVFQKLDNNRLLIDLYYEYSYPDVYSLPTELVNLKQPITITQFRTSEKANTKEINYGIGISYKKGCSEISYRLQYYKKGNFFGIMDVTPLKRDQYVKFLHQYVSYKFQKYLSIDWKETFEIGVKNYTWDGSYRLFPYDFNVTDDYNPENDVITWAKIHTLDYFVQNTLKYETLKHSAKFIINGEYAKPYGYDNKTYIPSLNYTLPYYPLKSDIKNISYGLAFTDLWSLTNNFALNYGYRFDHYNKFGDRSNYKLGVVYNKNNFTTLKFLFNTAYRIPSWVELYSNIPSFKGNSDLTPESIYMYEFIWLQRITNNDELKLSVYKGVNKNAIAFVDVNGVKEYRNIGNEDIRGFETVYDKNFKNLNFSFSYSYNDNKIDYSEVIGKVNRLGWLGTRKHWIKSYALYNFNKRLSSFVGILYGSKITTPKYVSDIPPYFSINMNLRYKIKNSIFQIGINNLTNHKNYYFAGPSDVVYGHYFFRFEKPEIPTPGRIIFISYERRW